MMKKKSKKARVVLGNLNPNAAGIDLGASSHWVALPADRTEETVREFECFTKDLEAMADWLQAHQITNVAMESTGVYWIPVYELLEKRGFEVHLVSTRHIRSVPGRKSDVEDCQWIQHLHECGLLRGSFRPQDAIGVMRGYVRHRDTLTEEASRHLLRMQKALDQMNIHLHKVVEDIAGESGLKIIDAILEGERDGEKLAALRNYRCRASKEVFIKSLTGNFREEHLFCLRQDLEAYRFVQKQIERCDLEILKRLNAFKNKVGELMPPAPKNPRDAGEVRLALFRAAGADLSLIPGLGSKNLQTIFAEVDFDLGKFPNEKAFAAWAALAPRNNITGGKQRRSRSTTSTNRVSQAFRVAAQTLANSRCALGAFYRRMRARKGPTFANAATAHKLARLFYRVLKYGLNYVEPGVDYYEERYKAHRKQSALKTLASLGFHATLEQIPTAVP
jgi:transposase